MSSESRKYDVIVIGAGHNGLTTAALLGKSGKRVLVLEAREYVGGLAAREEFFPGYKSNGLLHDTSEVRRSVVEALDLKAHGLRFMHERPPVLLPQRAGEGQGILLYHDPKKFKDEAPSASDYDAYERYRAFLNSVGEFIEQLATERPVQLFGGGALEFFRLAKQGLTLRSLGKKSMLNLLRIAPMCVADWLNEYFKNDLLKAGLAAPAIWGERTGPWSPGTNANLLLHESIAKEPVDGGSPALIAALLGCAKSHSVEVECSAPVKQILCDAGKVRGVRLESGEEILAATVASSCHPKHTFLNLVAPELLEHKFEQRIVNVRSRGTTAKVHLALSGALKFACRPNFPVEYARTGEHLDDLERAFDAVKYRQMSEKPMLDIYVPSVRQADLAPQGHSVVSILAHFAPYDLAGGWNEERCQELGARVLNVLESYAPGVKSLVVGYEVLSPLDLETRYRLPEGHIRHAEHAIDQLLVRPVPECAHYATPIAGLYLCGSGSHPGGGITCAPGALAAEVILKAA